jgi:hypothetical protein
MTQPGAGAYRSSRGAYARGKFAHLAVQGFRGAAGRRTLAPARSQNKGLSKAETSPRLAAWPSSYSAKPRSISDSMSRHETTLHRYRTSVFARGWKTNHQTLGFFLQCHFGRRRGRLQGGKLAKGTLGCWFDSFEIPCSRRYATRVLPLAWSNWLARVSARNWTALRTPVKCSRSTRLAFIHWRLLIQRSFAGRQLFEDHTSAKLSWFDNHFSQPRSSQKAELAKLLAVPIATVPIRRDGATIRIQNQTATRKRWF